MRSVRRQVIVRALRNWRIVFDRPWRWKLCNWLCLCKWTVVAKLRKLCIDKSIQISNFWAESNKGHVKSLYATQTVSWCQSTLRMSLQSESSSITKPYFLLKSRSHVTSKVPLQTVSLQWASWLCTNLHSTNCSKPADPLSLGQCESCWPSLPRQHSGSQVSYDRWIGDASWSELYHNIQLIYVSEAIETCALHCEEPEYPTPIHSEHCLIRQSAHLLEEKFLWIIWLSMKSPLEPIRNTAQASFRGQ